MGIEGTRQPLGTLRVEGDLGHERSEYRVLEGSCNSEEVLLYLEALAHKAEQEGKPCVVVLDNALFTPPESSESVRSGGKRGGSPFTGCRPTART
jgi:hypothetical protein